MKMMVVLILFLSVVSGRAFNSPDADTAFTAFNTAYYDGHDGSGRYKKDTSGGREDFWTQAEEIEMIEDVYERTGSAESRRMIGESIMGFTELHSTDWRYNKFNDDLMWMTIACARGYLMTSNQVFLGLAEKHFRAVCSRAGDNQLGGGLWWTTDCTSKNACVNGPAALAACLLYQITGEKSYLAEAESLYAWERRTLFNPATGAIYDNLQASGKIGHKVFTYNLGTFIGAANFLGQFTGDTNYFSDALLAANYAKNHLGIHGLLPAYGSGDAAGFNGIFVRWLGRFASDNHRWPEFYDWMSANAQTAWSIRRADNLSWQDWNQPTPPGVLESWNCSDTVVILQVVPLERPGKAN